MQEMRLPKAITISLIVVAGAASVLYGCRERFLDTSDIVEQGAWPQELVDLLDESSTEGDAIDNVDVRSAGFITTYAWRMPSTERRLALHLKRFQLAAASSRGFEHERILSRWPHAWSLPTADLDIYANPVGLPGADDGEFEFVLLHDKGTATIYFYYYFNF